MRGDGERMRRVVRRRNRRSGQRLAGARRPPPWRVLAALLLLTLVRLLSASAAAAGPADDVAFVPTATPPVGEAAGDTLRIVAYNIKHGLGMDGRVDLPRIAEALRSLDADVVTLQEVDDRTERTGDVDQVAVLAEALGYRGFHGPHRPYQGGFYGNAVLTRLPVRAVRTRPIPPASGSALAVLEVEVVLPSGGTASVVSVHLAGSVDERVAQGTALTGFFLDAEHPVVLAGDFNGRPDDPAVSGLRRDWRVAAKSGSPYTYPSDDPDREIDFVMTRPRDAVEVLEHRVVPEAMAADHRPLLAVLRVDAGDRP